MVEQATATLAEDVPTNIARRLVQRFGLTPRIDILGLARRFAEVTTVDFPFDADGVCCDPKPSSSGRSPLILINRHRIRQRRRFTLAHELGHILIPSHFGTIVDVLDAGVPLTVEMRFIEAEANRFASELLLPDDWLSYQAAGFDGNPRELCECVAEEADVSSLAVALRLIKHLPRGFGFAAHHGGYVTAASRSSSTYHDETPIEGMPITEVYPHASMVWPSRSEVTKAGVLWVSFPDGRVLPDLGPERDWRRLLNTILDEVLMPPDVRQKRWNSICAKIAAANGRSASREETYEYLLHSLEREGSSDLFWRRLTSHPKWKVFLGLRIRNLRPI